MGTKDVSDQEYITYLKDEACRLGEIADRLRIELQTARVRNRELQGAVKELLSRK